MKALILAAGKGERLKGLTADRPKAFVEICGRPLIEWVFDFLRQPLVTEIGVVGGYKFEVFNEYLKKETGTLQKGACPLFFNPLFHEGSVRTIMTALDFLDDEFILMNADHIYPPKMFAEFLKQKNGITAACDFDRKLLADDMKVKLDGKRCITSIQKGLKDFDCGYIGMTLVAKEKLSEYKEAVLETYKTKGKASNAEAVLGLLAEKGHKVSIADLSGFGWHEVDTKEDRDTAEEKLKV